MDELPRIAGAEPPTHEGRCPKFVESIVIPVAATISIYCVGRPLVSYGFWSPLNLYRFHCVTCAVHPPLRLHATLMSTAMSTLYEFQLLELSSAIARFKPIWRLDEVCRMFLGNCGWSFFWRRPMTTTTSPKAWLALRTILFSNTEERRKGMFMVTLYQETIEHAVDMINGGADAHILLCCVEVVSRILDQRDEDDFEMQQLRVPVIDGVAKQRIKRIQDSMVHGSMFLQKYERRRMTRM